MQAKERLNHALHNEELCTLLATTKFKDWRVTTAFYSALHFVQHKIFPISMKADNGGKFKVETFSQYRKAFAKSNLTKHEILLQLVTEKCDIISSEYEWLYSNCMNARYHHFNISDKVANRASETLVEIKAHCTN